MSHSHSYMNRDPYATMMCKRSSFTDDGVREMNFRALVSLRPEVMILDSYTLTKDKCGCSNISDGRHYHPLTPAWWAVISNIILHVSKV